MAEPIAVDILGSLGQATATGAALGAQIARNRQWQMDNNLRMQELRSQEAYRRMQERQLAQQLALQLENHNQAVQEKADMSKAIAGMQAENIMTQFGPQQGTGEALPPTQRNPTGQQIVKHLLPVIAKYRPQEVDNFLSNAAMYDYREQQAREQKSMTEPEIRATVDPVTGQRRSMARTGPNSWQLVQESASQRMFDKFKLDEQKRMLAVVEKNRLDLYKELPRDERGMRYVPDSMLDEVAKMAGITTKTRTDLEAAEIGAANVFALGKELLPLINERTTGAKAEAKRLLQRSGITALVPALDDPEISEAEAVGRQFSQGFIRAMRSDGNIGVTERDQLARAAETIEWTTPASGKRKLASIIRRAADTSRRASQTRGTPINPLFLTREEIRARVVAGEMTAKEGQELYNNTADNFLTTIQSQIN